MTDKKDKPEDAKTGTEKESKNPPAAKDAFDAVADFANDVTRELKEYREYFGEGTFMSDAADYVRKHGKDRLKTGAATTAKVAATTWKTGPLMKFTLPAAFAIGAIGGPKASEYVAGKMDKLAEKMPKFGKKSEASEESASDDDKPKPPTPSDP
mgnify:CR=1 FL=1